MKKLIIFILSILILFLTFSNVVDAGFEIWPGKLTITMNEWYDRWVETKYNKIHVTNPYSYGINISIKLDNPSTEVISEGYSNIPDFSWIKISPSKIYLPPYSSGIFEVVIEVPKDKQSNYFNEKWETWIIFDSNLYPGGQTGMNFKVELAVKLFINTPIGEASISKYLPIVLFLFSSIFVIIIIFYYIKKRKEYMFNNTKPSYSLFFYRKKKL